MARAFLRDVLDPDQIFCKGAGLEPVVKLEIGWVLVKFEFRFA
jgi:hypothetical protein